MNASERNMISTIPDDGKGSAEEAADGFVIIAGAGIYGEFDTDDEAVAWAVTRFKEFNVRAVIRPDNYEIA